MEEINITPLNEEGLNINRIKELWSKTYKTSGKPDWSHIYEYYHNDMVFEDCIQRVEGKEDFKKMCDRLTKRCKSLRMDILTIVQEEGIFIMEWKMTMAFRKAPDTPIYGCTKLKIHKDGRIIEQRDYYDLWGDIFNGIPGFKKLYRKGMHRFFG